MRIAYVKLNRESADYVIHGIGLLSAIAKGYGHESVWANPTVGIDLPVPVDAVAITACSDVYPLAVQVAKAYKAHNPNIRVWVGGPHATFVPDDFEKVPEFDHVVIGEGEAVWDGFCRGNIPPSRIIDGASPWDLNALPFADRNQERNYHIVSELPPEPLRLFPAPYRCVLAGRGCKYNCTFCKPGTNLIFGKKSRRRSVDNVLAELDTMEVGSVFIHDDDLVEDTEWCEEWAERWCGKPYLIQGRADLMIKHEKLLEKMVNNGLVAMLCGFESGSVAVLKRMRKGSGKEANIKAAAVGHRLGIVMQANIMFGTPEEQPDDVYQTLELIEKHLRPCIVSPAVYTPYPGSDWGRIVNEKGWNLVKDTYDYGRGIGGRKLAPEALGYTYEWLEEAIKDVRALGYGDGDFWAQVAPKIEPASAPSDRLIPLGVPVYA